MTVYRIPTRQDSSSYAIQVTLDGVTYTLSFDWNVVTEAWFLTIADIAGVVLLASRRIILDFPLLTNFPESGLPAGEFIAYDSTGKNQEATLDDLGTRVILIYGDASDVAEALAEIA